MVSWTIWDLHTYNENLSSEWFQEQSKFTNTCHCLCLANELPHLIPIPVLLPPSSYAFAYCEDWRWVRLGNTLCLQFYMTSHHCIIHRFKSCDLEPEDSGVPSCPAINHRQYWLPTSAAAHGCPTWLGGHTLVFSWPPVCVVCWADFEIPDAAK